MYILSVLLFHYYSLYSLQHTLQRFIMNFVLCRMHYARFLSCQGTGYNILMFFGRRKDKVQQNLVTVLMCKLLKYNLTCRKYVVLIPTNMILIFFKVEYHVYMVYVHSILRFFIMLNDCTNIIMNNMLFVFKVYALFVKGINVVQ